MAVLLRNWLGCIRTQRIYFRKMKSVYLYLYLYSACTYQERLKMTPPPFNGKKGASFLPLPLKNKVSSQLVHPIFFLVLPLKNAVVCLFSFWFGRMLFAKMVLNADIPVLYGLCFQNLLVLFVVIEQKFWGGITLYVYTCMHTFRFNII